MIKIIHFFWQICIFKKGPEQVPTAPVFVAVVITAYLLVSVLASLFEPALDGNIIKAILVVLVSTAVQLSIFTLLLLYKNMFSRVKETLLALLGSDTLLTLIGIAILAVHDFLNGNLESGEPAIQVSRFALTALVVWSLAVTGFILHKATNTGLFLGNAIALGSLITAQIVVIEMFLPNISNLPN